MYVQVSQRRLGHFAAHLRQVIACTTVLVLPLALGCYGPLPSTHALRQTIERGSAAEVAQAITAQNVNSRIQVGSDERFWELPLHLACQRGNVEVVDVILRAGADVNAVNYQGKTALSECVWVESDADRATLIHRLLDLGANIDYQDPEHGRTALMDAMAWRPCAAKDFLRAGADTTLQSRQGGRTALDYLDEDEPCAEEVRALVQALERGQQESQEKQ